VNGSGSNASKFQSYSSLAKLSTFVTGFFEKYPLATEQLLAHEHKSYFFNIAQRSGQKLAPFVPILDSNFEVWFKKVRPLRMVFKRSSTHSFFIGFSLGVRGYRSCLRPGPRRSAPFDKKRTSLLRRCWITSCLVSQRKYRNATMAMTRARSAIDYWV